jgi:ketosteroid isomerase-like protein
MTASNRRRVRTVADGGDLAYLAGYERFNVSIEGCPVEPYTLRMTHISRSEDGKLKIVHRHGDLAPPVQSPPEENATTQPRH